jgi:serine/threonine protein phosphatase PrpC
MLKLYLVDSLTIPSADFNEDWFDYNDQAAWVFDGASGIARNTIPGAASDPQWLVQIANFALNQTWDDRVSTKEILVKAAAIIAQEYNDLMGSNAPPIIERPTACLTIARLFKSHLEISVIGDSGAIYQGKDGNHVYGCEPIEAAIPLQAELRRLKAQNLDAAELKQALLPHHYAMRSQANAEGGYGIVDTTMRWPDKVQTVQIEVRPGDRLLLLTDGFYRLVDVFENYTPAQLIDAVTDRGIFSLYQELRQLEGNDEKCLTHLRFKARDDVTAALFSLT